MLRRAAAALVLIVPRLASAEPHMSDYIAEVARGLAGENLPVPPRLALVAHGGGATDLDEGGWIAGGGAGVTWGTENTGLFGEIKLHRVLLTGRWSSDDDDTATPSASTPASPSTSSACSAGRTSRRRTG